MASISDDGNRNPVGDSTNWTYRYNFFTHAMGTGGLMYVGTGMKVYGNNILATRRQFSR